MCLQVAGFFSPGPGGLVGDEENLILDCYWLAHWYHQSPDVFLSMTFADVRLHMQRTAQMTRLMRASASDGD